MIKRWKYIKGFEGYYKISNYGEVKSYLRNKPKIIKPYKNIYLYYKLFHKHYSAHRLVAKHFIPNPKNKPEVNHIDGNKFNNHVENLEWVTRKENMQHNLYVLGKNSNTKKQRMAARNNINNGIKRGRNRLKSVPIYCNETKLCYFSKGDVCNIFDTSLWKLNKHIAEKKPNKINGYSFKIIEKRFR
jgi:hypothetical protein